jgi:hypothetical protein
LVAAVNVSSNTTAPGGVGVGVAVGVFVGVAVGVAVGVFVGVGVTGVPVGVGVGVFVGVGVPPAVIVKLTSEISKKILPTASILIRPVVVGVLGIVKLSVPSFGVLAERTVGKVFPPSVESEIFTFAALTGAASVPLTFHVMTDGAPPTRDTAVFGAVTWNGPAAAETTRLDDAVLIPPVAA